MNTLKTTALLAVMTGLLVSIAYAFGGPEDGRQYALVALAFAGVMNLGTYWFSDKIVLAMYKAHPAEPHTEPRLYSIVERLAQKSNMPMPKVYVIPTGSPNAFATGRSPSRAAVAATLGIMEILDDAELEGVMAHELSHVKNRDTLVSAVAATLGGAISALARALGRSGGRNRGKGAALGMLVAVILAPIAAMLVQMAVSRGREYVADRDGARMCGNPRALAGALEKLQRGVMRDPMPDGIGNEATAHMCIVNPFKGGAVMADLFSTHPPVEERVRRLRNMRV